MYLLYINLPSTLYTLVNLILITNESVTSYTLGIWERLYTPQGHATRSWSGWVCPDVMVTFHGVSFMCSNTILQLIPSVYAAKTWLLQKALGFLRNICDQRDGGNQKCHKGRMVLNLSIFGVREQRHSRLHTTILCRFMDSPRLLGLWTST